MGLSPISWQELKAFDDCNGLELNGWEFTRLMEMSRAYCSWYAKGGEQSDIADDVPHIDKTKNAGSYLIKQREISKKKTESPQL